MFRVEKYTDPEVALSNFKPGAFDLALLDIKSPNMDSFELYDKMKRADKKLKVCFLGTYDNEESYQALRNEFPSLEAECFMSKPIKVNDLIRRVQRTLS